MRLRRLKQIRFLTISLLIVILIGLPIFATPLALGSVSISTAPTSPFSIGSTASEEENIDDFSVHPASGRWNTTNDALTDDRIVDDNLRLITVDNTTTDIGGFEMNRDLRKTDGKVEWRSKADGSGNQTEYFRDSRGDEADFTEDTDGSSGFDGGSVSASNGILKNSRTIADSTFGFLFDTNNISAFVYNKIEIKYKLFGYNDDTDFLNLRLLWFKFGAPTTNNFLMTTTYSEDWTIFEKDFSGVADWETTFSGNIVQLIVRILDDGVIASERGIEVDYVKIIGDLDFATHIEGEIEDTWDFEEADEEGFFDNGRTAEVVAGGFVNLTVNVPGVFLVYRIVGATIDSSLFTSFQVRINASDATSFVFPTDTGANRLGSNMDLDGSLTILTWDLSDDSDWSGTEANLGFQISEDDGNLDNGDQFFIDYALLKGEWDDVDSVIGLYDDDVSGPLLNVTTRFFSNSSVGARYEIELLDLSGEIAYRAVSENFTDLGDLWVRGKITYDSLRSSLIVDMKADNLSRIIKVTFPKDFTAVSGRVPALFQLDKSPGVFISTATPAVSWQELTIGFIRAPFAKNNWFTIVESTNVNVTQKNWDTARILGTSAAPEENNYSLVVPYLDAVSGSLNLEFNNTAFSDTSFLAIYFILYAVDADDGDLHAIFSTVLVISEDGAGNTEVLGMAMLGDDPTPDPEFFIALPYTGKQPRMDFSVRLSKDRDRVSAKARFIPDIVNETVTHDFVYSQNISSLVTDPSQEFVLKTRFFWDMPTFDGVSNLWIDDLGFIERDIFSAIVQGVIEPAGNFLSQIFIAIGRFLAEIYRIIGSLIILAIEIAVSSLIIAIGLITTAIATMQGVLETAIGLVTTAIGTLQTALETAIGLVTTAVDAVTTAIGLLAADIATAVWDGIGVALDFITDAIADIAGDVADAIVAVLGDVVDFLLTLIADIAELVDDVLQVVIPLLLTFLGTILADIAGFIQDVINTVIDLFIPTEISDVFDIAITAVVEIITAIPTFIIDIMLFLSGIATLFVVAGFVIFFILPIAQGASTGDFISHATDNMAFDLTFGLSLLGISIRLPAVFPWIVLMVFQMLVGTPFIDFFS